MKNKVLWLIDDDEDEYMLLKSIVEHIHAPVEIRYFTRQPVEAVWETGTATWLYLDINLPIKSGWMVLDELSSRHYPVPIIIYSTSNQHESILRGYELGATLYFSKPSSYSHLLSCFKAFLDLDWTNPGRIRDTFFNKDFRAEIPLPVL